MHNKLKPMHFFFTGLVNQYFLFTVSIPVTYLTNTDWSCSCETLHGKTKECIHVYSFNMITSHSTKDMSTYPEMFMCVKKHVYQ